MRTLKRWKKSSTNLGHRLRQLERRSLQLKSDAILLLPQRSRLDLGPLLLSRLVSVVPTRRRPQQLLQDLRLAHGRQLPLLLELRLLEQ